MVRVSVATKRVIHRLPVKNSASMGSMSQIGVYSANVFAHRCRKRRLGPAFGINGLVEIDPEYAGKECDRGRERQEQHDCPDVIFRDPPPSHGPQQRRDERDDHEPQSVTEIHGAQEVAWFPLKLEIAEGTAVVHLRKSPEDGIAKNAPHAAPGTALAQDTSQR